MAEIHQPFFKAIAAPLGHITWKISTFNLVAPLSTIREMKAWAWSDGEVSCSHRKQYVNIEATTSYTWRFPKMEVPQ